MLELPGVGGYSCKARDRLAGTGTAVQCLQRRVFLWGWLSIEE